MKVYKVRNKETGLFSTGGMTPSFNKRGKTWTQINHVKSHLTQFRSSSNISYYSRNAPQIINYLNEVEIVEYNLTEQIDNIKIIEVSKD
jgi:hypothetical protein